MPAGTAVPDLSIAFNQSVTIVLRRGSIARYTPSISGAPTSEWLTDAEILDRLITHPEQIFVEAGELLQSTLIVAMPPLLGHIRLVDDGTPVSPDDGIRIHLGTEQADRLMRPYGCASELLDADGYALLAAAPRGDLLVDLFITGGSAYGVFFGVSWFLHTYLGARWLFPGKDGEVIPSVEEVAFRAVGVNRVDEPNFWDRTMAGMSAPAYTPTQTQDFRSWMLRNRMRPFNQRYSAMENQRSFDRFAGTPTSSIGTTPAFSRRPAPRDSLIELVESRFNPIQVLSHLLAPWEPPADFPLPQPTGLPGRADIRPEFYPDVRIRDAGTGLVSSGFDLDQITIDVQTLFGGNQRRARIISEDLLIQQYGVLGDVYGPVMVLGNGTARFIPLRPTPVSGFLENDAESPAAFHPCFYEAASWALRPTTTLAETRGSITFRDALAVDLALQARRVFDSSHAGESFPIALIDGGLFCQCLPCFSQQEFSPVRNSAGQAVISRRYSAHVYDLAQSIALNLFGYPILMQDVDRKLVFLAYNSYCGAPPLRSLSYPPPAVLYRPLDIKNVFNRPDPTLSAPTVASLEQLTEQGKTSDHTKSIKPEPIVPAIAMDTRPILNTQSMPARNKESLRDNLSALPYENIVMKGNESAEGLANSTVNPKEDAGARTLKLAEPLLVQPAHVSLMPYLTGSRDIDDYEAPTGVSFVPLETLDRQNVEDWSRLVSQLGLYEYMHGSSRLTPRMYARRFAFAVNHGYQFRARGFIAEADPNWGLDAPMYHIAASLLWDQTQEVDQLLIDYCNALVGPEASSPVVRAFQWLEKLWTDPASRLDGPHGAVTRNATEFELALPLVLNNFPPKAYSLAAFDHFSGESMAQCLSLLEEARGIIQSSVSGGSANSIANRLKRLDFHRLPLRAVAPLCPLFSAWNKVDVVIKRFNLVNIDPADPLTRMRWASRLSEVLPPFQSAVNTFSLVAIRGAFLSELSQMLGGPGVPSRDERTGALFWSEVVSPEFETRVNALETLSLAWFFRSENRRLWNAAHPGQQPMNPISMAPGSGFDTFFNQVATLWNMVVRNGRQVCHAQHLEMLSGEALRLMGSSPDDDSKFIPL